MSKKKKICKDCPSIQMEKQIKELEKELEALKKGKK